MCPTTVSANIRPLSADLQEIAIKELNEVPERVTHDIEAIKTWIHQQPHLNARTDDQFLLAFLRGCKYRMEKVKSKIDRFYTLRTKYPDVLGGRGFNMERTLELLRLGVNIYLPTPLHGNGPRIGLIRSGAYDPSRYNFADFMLLGQLYQEIAMCEDDYAIVNGVIHIIDYGGVSGAHLMQVSPSLMKKITVWNEEAVPLRPKANHFVNSPMGFEPIFNMIKPMFSKKQQERLFVHGNKLHLLHQQIPKEYLPAEYGGSNGTIQDLIVHWEKRFREYQSYFEAESQYGTNEKLRPGKPIDFENTFGLEGSFRKLVVD